MRSIQTALLLAGLLTSPSAHAAIWTVSAEVAGNAVEVDVSVRLSGCAGIGRVERQLQGTEAFVVWQGDDSHAVDTVESFDSCKCEPLGTAWGTGMKSCPEEQCGKDDQCVCTELCAPVVDACPPPGTLDYVVFDRDGAEVATTQIMIPDRLAGCDAPPEPEPVVAEPEEKGGGGCRTAPTASSPAVLLLGLLLLVLLRRPLSHRLGPPAALLGRRLTATGLGPRLFRPARSRLASGTDPVARDCPQWIVCGGSAEVDGGSRRPTSRCDYSRPVPTSPRLRRASADALGWDGRGAHSMCRRIGSLWPTAHRSLLTAFLLASALALGGGCARGKRVEKAAAAPLPPQPVESSVEGTPFEAVVGIQSELLDLFENGTSAESVLWRADRFRKKRVEPFRKVCSEALEFYSQDAANRMLILSSAGRVWNVVQQRVKALSGNWSPAQRRQADVLLDQFECR